jgi:hypothetical protein
MIAISEINQTIEELEGNGKLVFDNICQTYGNITNLESFKEFYKNYFLDFQIFDENEFEKEAIELWVIIDKNKNNILDEDEIEPLVGNICLQSINKIKNSFNIII